MTDTEARITRFFDILGLIIGPVREWSPAWRKVYLLTLPISFPLLCILNIVIAFFMLTMMAILGVTYFPLKWFVATWEGKKMKDL